MPEHIPESANGADQKPEMVQAALAVYRLPAYSFQVSDRIPRGTQYPAGARILRMDVIIPPGILNEESMSGLLLPTGQPTNPLDGNLPIPPIVEITISPRALSASALAELESHQAQTPAAPAALAGANDTALSPRIAALLAPRP